MGMVRQSFEGVLNRAANDLAPVRTQPTVVEPQRYIFREMTVALNGGLQFFYKDPERAQSLPGGGIEEVIAGLVAPVGFSFLAEVSAPALETPLDLNIRDEPAYVVLRLDPTINWRFSASYPAVSLKDAAVEGSYGGLRHVLPGGVIQDDPGAGCNLIYFIAQPPPEAPNGEYRHGLNFHVELSQNISGSGTGILPIIIDPDVGHPGGSPT